MDGMNANEISLPGGPITNVNIPTLPSDIVHESIIILRAVLIYKP